MLNLSVTGKLEGTKTVLALGAHCDDIEIGCGAAMRQLASQPGSSMTWVVFTSNETRAAEAQAAFESITGECKDARLILESHRDGFMPWNGEQVKERFEQLKSEINPDVIFTHYRHDLHQDHRLVCDLTWNTFRDHLILEYEIPKWDGDIGNPNAYLPVSTGEMDQKVQAILDSYRSQSGKPWFTADLFRSLARIRGMECGAPSGLAEAFHARKLALEI